MLGSITIPTEENDMISAIFWNVEEGRLRAGWRISLQILLVAVPLAILAAMGFYSTQGSIPTRVALTALPITLVSIFVLGRYIDKRRFSDFGLQLRQSAWWVDYGFGALAGFIAATSYVFLLLLLGWAELSPGMASRLDVGSLVRALLIPFFAYVSVGIFEELIRTYQIRNITEALAQTRLRVAGASLSAIILAGGWSVIGHLASGDPYFLLFVFISAVIYGLCFLWTQRVALAMALHFAWDFTLSSIFLLGTEGAQEAALFVVSVRDAPSVDINLLPILGIVPKLLMLFLVVAWIRRREGEVRLQRELAKPSLVIPAVDAA